MTITIKDVKTLYIIYQGYVSKEYLKRIASDRDFIIEVKSA